MIFIIRGQFEFEFALLLMLLGLPHHMSPPARVFAFYPNFSVTYYSPLSKQYYNPTRLLTKGSDQQHCCPHHHSHGNSLFYLNTHTRYKEKKTRKMLPFRGFFHQYICSQKNPKRCRDIILTTFLLLYIIFVTTIYC